MGDEKPSKAKLIEQESPQRLRALITALSQHTGAHVLRVEVGFTSPTTETATAALTMTVTHSLGPGHELAIGPMLGDAFARTLFALQEMAHAQKDDDEHEP